MIQCPYCGRDMKKGFIEADGRSGLIWVEKDKKRSIASKVNNSDCIVLDGYRIFNKARGESNYCENCKKIVIDVKLAMISPEK